MSAEIASSRSGQVYFVQAGEDGPVKIGWAKDADTRIRRLQTGSPIPLKPLAVVNTDHALRLEAKLHGRFERERLHGEWFDRCDDMDKLIQAIRSRSRTGPLFMRSDTAFPDRAVFRFVAKRGESFDAMESRLMKELAAAGVE